MNAMRRQPVRAPFPLGGIAVVAAILAASLSGCVGGLPTTAPGPEGGGGSDGSGGGGEPTAKLVVSLSGLVSDSETGIPLADSMVIFGGQATTTGADGRYTFTNAEVLTRDGLEGSPVPLTVSKHLYGTFLQDLPVTNGASIVQDVGLISAPDTGTVRGLVKAEGTLSPIANALVSIGPGSYVQRGRTANDGSFQVSGVLSGEQPYTVEATGYLNHSGRLDNVPAGLAFSLPTPILLTPQGSSVTVRGSVTDESGQPISAAKVTIGGISGTTRADGTFELNGVLVGTQTVTASAEGYQTTSFTTEVSSSMAPLTIVLFAGSVNPPGLPYNLQGTVTLVGQPEASGVQVSAMRQSDGIVMDTFVTGANGEYRLLVPAGSYVVRAEKPGYVPQERIVTVPPGGQVVSGVDFSLAPASAMSRGRRTGRGERRLSPPRPLRRS